MRNLIFFNLLFLIVLVVSGCEKEFDIIQLPEQFSAGQDTIIYDTTTVKLNATSLDSINLIGTWSVVKGGTLSSSFSDIHNPKAIFKGNHLNTYILRWSVSNGIDEKHSDVRVVIGDIFTDARDNKIYKKIKIGDQIWMAEDLKADKYADGISLILKEDNTSIYYSDLNNKFYFKKSYYYDYGISYPINEEGYYYTWGAVMNNSSSNNNSPSGVQGICPNGWHVPSSQEFSELSNFIAGDYEVGKVGLALRSNYAWNECMYTGTNYYGFSALAKGFHYSDTYGEAGISSTFWTTLESEYELFGKIENAYLFDISFNTAKLVSSMKNEGRCVRCLQNK